MSEYVSPEYHSTGFRCPYCRTHAVQEWWNITLYDKNRNVYTTQSYSIGKEEVEISCCSRCQKPIFWLGGKSIFPPVHMSPPANSDLPDDVQKVYEEAAAIANQSPRAASALLRLAIEMLLEHLGETGTINDRIKNLVKKGLDESIQQALDIVRVTGNNAVHPGEIDFNDSTDVQTLFGLINFIADDLITRRKKIDAMYNRLPEAAREGIKKRDGKTE